MALLETKSLTKSFGALTAVDGVSLAVEAGSLHSIIGPNGAGKTTLFNLLTGTFPPTSGQILFDRKDITGTPASRVAHLGLARSYQRTTVFPAFSLFDNVWVAAFATGKSWKGLLHKKTGDYAEVAGRATQALQDVGLEQKSTHLARELSHGEQRQLELAIALAAAPRVLLLDEPAAGLRHKEKQALVDVLRQLQREGMSILLVEHDMDLVMEVCDRLVVMEFGTLLMQGTPREVQRSPEVRAAYLGTEH